MRVKTVGRDVYQMDRSFDVLDKAASNEGTSGTVLGAGMGLGLGLGFGAGLGAQASNVAGSMKVGGPPPLPTSSLEYYVAIDGNQQGPFIIPQLQELVKQEKFSRDSLVWKTGMASWGKAGEQPELQVLFQSVPPPLPK